MNQQPDLTQNLFEVIRAWADGNYPFHGKMRLVIDLPDGEKVRLPIPPALPCPQAAPREEEHAELGFVPNAFQTGILGALEGKAMRTDALAAKVGDRRRIFRHPGGIKELIEQGLVGHHPRIGYYRPDTPPPELAEEAEGE